MNSERITVTGPAGAFGAYVARPSREPAPAVVVLQEIFGVNAQMREITDGLAGQGYLAICPDLFWRLQPGVEISEDERPRAFELYSAFDIDGGIADIQATIDHIRRDPGCSGKVAAVGFCLGGKLAYLSGCRTDIDASIGYYGVGIEERLDEAKGLERPLMLHIAEEDGFVPKPAQDAIRTRLADNPLVVLYSYPDREHAFARPRGQHYHEADAMVAGQRSLDFLRAHIGNA